MRSLLCLPLIAASSLYADDTIAPPSKKEAIHAIPHVWLSGGLLCLQAKESRLDYATAPQPIAPGANYAGTDLTQPHFNWNCGIRLEAGYQPRDVLYFANWTHIVNTAHGTKSTDATEGFFPVWSLNKALNTGDYVTSAHLEWDLNTHQVDLGAIYAWDLNKYFIFKMRGALRTLFLDQTYKVEYGGGIYNQGIDTMNMNNDFWGIGPAIGFTPCVILGQGFSLFGDLGGSMLFGRFFVKQRERYLERSLISHSDTLGRVKFNIDAKAALSWQTELAYRSLLFGVQLGWEWHKYYGQNQLSQSRFELMNHRRNLIERGVSLMLTLGF